jgi:putative ABC transport system permease protein
LANTNKKTVYTRIQNKHDLEVNWKKAVGFIPLAGEVVIYDKEVDNYITRENLILTILGIIPGFVLGYFLTFITIGTVEMENTRFLRVVSPMSYIYAAIISLVLTFIVNFVTHFTLKKIDMIESLKSVE